MFIIRRMKMAQAELAERVLSGLKVKLMATEATTEALAGYAEETARLNQGRDARQSADKARLETVERAIQGLVSAIEDGGYSHPLMTRGKDLEAEADALTQRLTEAPANDAEPTPTDFMDRYTCQIAETGQQPAKAPRPQAMATKAPVCRSRCRHGPGSRPGQAHPAKDAFADANHGRRKRRLGEPWRRAPTLSLALKPPYSHGRCVLLGRRATGRGGGHLLAFIDAPLAG